jgi:hypothetical protein
MPKAYGQDTMDKIRNTDICSFIYEHSMWFSDEDIQKKLNEDDYDTVETEMCHSAEILAGDIIHGGYPTDLSEKQIMDAARTAARLHLKAMM